MSCILTETMVSRLKLFKNGARSEGGKMVVFPKSFQELLEVASKELKIKALRIFSMDGAEVDNILLLRDDESVLVSCGEDFIGLSPNVGNVVPCSSVLKSKVSMNAGNREWVTLNVGGTRFVTTRSTLTKDPDSMLARMFSSDGVMNYRENDHLFHLDKTEFSTLSKKQQPLTSF
eukprot:gene12412-3075_t